MAAYKCYSPLFVAGVFAVSFLPGVAQQPVKEGQRHDFSKVDDSKFAGLAEQINLTEISAGNLAATKGKRAEVQQFGRKMVTDHTDANRKLAAAAKNQTLSGKLDAKHQAKVDKLSGLDGDEFDRAYIHEMVKGHQMANDLFEHESANGRDANLKAYAAEIHPHVRQHGLKAKEIWTNSFSTTR